MSNAAELLKRTLRHFHKTNCPSALAEDIENFLAAEPEADHFCDSHCTWLDHHPDCKQTTPEPEAEPVGEIDGLARACNLAGIDYKDFLRIKAYMPIPPRPEPSRKPMTKEEIWNGCEKTNSGWFPRSFAAGVRWAEQHHGISSSIPSLNDTISANSRDSGHE